MKILMLNGSPKDKSDTFRLAEAFIEGLTRYVGHEVQVVHVIKKNIAPCAGCFGCWEKADNHCVIQDDMNWILDGLLAADLVIWNFPVYVCGVPGHLKTLLDRTLPLTRQEANAEGNLYKPVHIRTMFISGCGSPDHERNFNGVKQTFFHQFGRCLGICVPQTPILNNRETAEEAEALLQRFRLAGGEFCIFGTLLPETVANLERPVYPKGEYLEMYKRWYGGLQAKKSFEKV